MRLYADQIENAAGDMLAEAAIRIGKLCRFIPAGGWELQHIQRSVILHGDFLSVRPVICFAEYHPAVCKINCLSHFSSLP